MATPNQKTLLASLLALSDLEITLSEDEKSSFRRIAKQLLVAPDAWELIEPHLRRLISKNSQLVQLFQNYESRLDRLEGNIPLPTEIHLETLNDQNLSKPNVLARGPQPRQVETKSHELVNMAIRVMENDPLEMTKKTTYFEEVKQCLGE